MQRELVKHPLSPASPVTRIFVDANRSEDGATTFLFTAMGDVAKVRIPAEGEPRRLDELWRHTCFEAFVAPRSGTPYYELNFSPSRSWAVYRFGSYRSGMGEPEIAPPALEPKRRPPLLCLMARLSLATLPELAPRERWRLGLSAVIEADDGSRSYWALAHPRGKPDFHHRDCFATELAPAAAA